MSGKIFLNEINYYCKLLLNANIEDCKSRSVTSLRQNILIFCVRDSEQHKNKNIKEYMELPVYIFMIFLVQIAY